MTNFFILLSCSCSPPLPLSTCRSRSFQGQTSKDNNLTLVPLNCRDEKSLWVFFEIRVLRLGASNCWSLPTSLADCLAHFLSLWIQRVRPSVEVTWPLKAILLDEISFKMTPVSSRYPHLPSPLIFSLRKQALAALYSLCSTGANVKRKDTTSYLMEKAIHKA